MSTFFIVLIVLILFWPWISRFFMRIFSGFMARRSEDMFRRMMGMPSRKEEKRKKKKESRFKSRRKNDKKEEPSYAAQHDTAAAMRSIAEDVEFTEIVEFESTTIAEDTPSGTRICQEEQVTDAEFVEIKDQGK